MTTTRRHPDNLDEALRAMDPAAPVTDAQRQRSAQLLEQAMREPSGSSPHQVSLPRLRRRAKYVLLPVAACAVAAAVVVIPGSGQDAAYASWTAVPRPLTPAELSQVGPECLDRADSDLAENVSLALAERRGDHVALLYRDVAGDGTDVSVSCFAGNVPGSGNVRDVSVGTSGGVPDVVVPPADSFTQGAVSEQTRPPMSMTNGAVGEDVVAVTIHALGVTTQATVADGRYIAWWPGLAFDQQATAVQDSTEGGCAGDCAGTGPVLDLTYDLELTDGTVLRDVAPARSS